jgi:hypothetical protein
MLQYILTKLCAGANMGAGYSNYLKGDCLNTPEDNGMSFFKTVNTNIVFSSPNCNQQLNSGFFGCGSYPFLSPPSSYTEQIPQNYIPPSNSIMLGKNYGRSSNIDVVTLKTYTNNDDVYFNNTELNPWKPKKYCPAPYNINNRSGPAYTNCHAYGSMVRKLANQNSYTDRLYFDWLDGFQLPYAGYNWKTCNEPCVLNNWLIMSHPATFMYTSIPQPFLINDHFEESGSPCPSDATNGGLNYIPFCAPMNVRKSDGTLIGQYTGLSFCTVFGMANLAIPVRPYLPPDEWSPVPPPNTPEVNPRRMFIKMEVWCFWRGTSVDPNYLLGSPLIQKQAYYFYSLAPGGAGQSRDWRFPFRLIFAQGVYGNFDVPITLNIVGGGTQNIVSNLSNMKALVSY